MDADEYLAFLHRTPGGDGTWMAKIKGVSTTIRAGSHVPAPVFDAPPLDDEKQQCRRKERAFALTERRRRKALGPRSQGKELRLLRAHPGGPEPVSL